MPINKSKAQKLLQEIKKLAEPFDGNLGGTPAPVYTPPPATDPNVITLPTQEIQGDPNVMNLGTQVIKGDPAPTGGEGTNYFDLNPPSAPKPRYYAPVGNPAVKKMQEAMQRLADAVIRDSISGSNFKNPHDAVQHQADDRTLKFKKSFNDFIAEQYASSVPDEYKGTEWSQDSTVQTQQDKSVGQTDLYELDAVLNTMKRIGSPGSEFKADGFWQFRTNNALMNMLAFGYSLLSMEGDFGITSSAFTKDDMDQMKTQLSGYTVEGDNIKGITEADKATRAAKISDILKKITKMYIEFRQKVSTKPQFVPLIEGKSSFDKYNANGSNVNHITKQDEQVIQSNPEVSGVNIVGYSSGKEIKVNKIPLSALQSPEAFKAFLKQIGNSDQQIQQYAAKIAKDIVAQLDAIKDRL